MREAIGGAYIFQIVVFFILLFTGFMSLSINYSRAFNVSTEIANIIERNNGFSTRAQGEISQYLVDVGYRTKGNCNSNEDVDYDGYDLSAESLIASGDSNKKSTICLKTVKLRESDSKEFPETAYYRVKVFFKLDLPIMSSLFEFEIRNSTRQLYFPIDS